MPSNPPLILASASPRRSELLASAGICFSIHPADVDESLHPGEGPEDYALRLAKNKAEAVSRIFPRNVILAADTIVLAPPDHDGVRELLGKPADAGEAKEMLFKLQASSHDVLTAFCIKQESNGYEKTRVVRTEVIFRTLDEEEIDAYARSGEPMDKAGAYAIQGKACGFVAEIRGSYTNVVGLPLAEVISELKLIGAGIYHMLTSTGG